ncbi:MAG: ATP-dependent RecD-like DNA helicase [Firmicutes bacterium]|nr:ATP-dependent RecD-like DNA helicase [Bacillota bacterium]MDY3658937.1 ATP-dependent RecD-like DNA helicase [Eubacteriales bacterium]
MCDFEGVIERIKFRNEENGYTVAVVSSSDDEITVVGKFLTINIGEAYKFFGDFSSSKFGEQFDVDHYEPIEPKTEKGIVKYLSSGLIKGVGPVTAKAIVKEFGKNTLEVIEFNPDKLLKIKGISKKKIDVISQSFLDVKEMQNAMIFLQTYNISANMAIRIFDTYRGMTVTLVKQNPYRLVEDVNGIGFLSADKIAMSMGIEKTSLFRIRAGIVHLLSETSEKSGSTYIYRAQLDNMLKKLLDLDEEVCFSLSAQVYEILQKESVVKVFWKDKKEIVALSKLYNTEKSVGAKLALLSNSAVKDDLNLDGEISAFETKHKLMLHEDQKNAVKLAIENGVSVITGGPGTGKTTIISCVIEIFQMLNKKFILLAPTGRAAKRLSETTGLNARTIHRALEINFKQDKNLFVYNEENPLNCDVVIVDEVSMVDVVLMNNMLRAIPKGAKLILVGDKDQLPSVGVGNVLADILESEIVPVANLTKIYRQENDSLIISNAHLINGGKLPVIDNRSSDFFFEVKDNVEDTKQSVVELVTKRLPKFLGIEPQKIQVLAPLKAGVCGIENLNKELQQKINPPNAFRGELVVGTMALREGDKVMQMSNNYNLEWKRFEDGFEELGKGVFNGDIGRIKHIDAQTGEVEIAFEDKKVATYPRGELGQISLAYAITIHKSQGSEFDVVVIPVVPGPSLILTRNLIYTAVTRAKKMVVLVGDKSALGRMVKNNFTTKRYTLLKDFLIEENKKMKLLFGD